MTKQPIEQVSNTWRVRDFTLDDFDAVLSLWKQYPDALGIGRSDTREEIAKKVEHDPDLFLLAEDNGEIVGSVIGGYDGRRGLVYHLAVARSHRGSGLGRALMEEIEHRLADRGCLRAYLLVTPANRDVIEFYQRLGWDVTPNTIMAKNLD